MLGKTCAVAEPRGLLLSAPTGWVSKALHHSGLPHDHGHVSAQRTEYEGVLSRNGPAALNDELLRHRPDVFDGVPIEEPACGLRLPPGQARDPEGGRSDGDERVPEVDRHFLALIFDQGGVRPREASLAFEDLRSVPPSASKQCR